MSSKNQLRFLVADPGFSREVGRGANSQSGCANVLFCKFSAKNFMKMEEIGARGSMYPWRPLGSATASISVNSVVDIYVTVSGHSPLSRPVAWRRSSSPIGLGYWRYASAHPLNVLQMAALRAAIWTHIATERLCLHGRHACTPLLNFL